MGDPHVHAENLADALVRTRRAQGLVEEGEETKIYEDRCAAVREHLQEVYDLKIDTQDAAALLNLRGPRDAEQGNKLLGVLQDVSNALIGKYVRPRPGEHRGAFWKEFVEGREAAIEGGLRAWRQRFQGLVDEVSRVVTNGDSPREEKTRDL